MKESSRNVAVGVTVIVALVILGGMILLFAGLPEIFLRGYQVKIASDNSYDAHVGDLIHLSGLRIGRLLDIRFADPARPEEGILFIAKIDNDIDLPGNARLNVYSKGFVGSAYLQINGDGPERINPATGEPYKTFPRDGSEVMSTVYNGAGLIPEEMTKAFTDFGALAKNLNEMIAPSPAEADATTTAPATAPADQEPGLRGTFVKLNRTLDALSTVMGDVQNQQNIKTSLAHLSEATAAAAEAMKSLKEFTEQARLTAKDYSGLADKLIEGAEKISDMMTGINRVIAKIDQGEGTAGKLLNDPKLYHSLLEATEEMNRLLGDFRQLLGTWQEKGVDIKLK